MTQLLGMPAAFAELLSKDPLLIRVLYERRRSDPEKGPADVFRFEALWAGETGDTQDNLLYVSTTEADIQPGQVDSVDKKHLVGVTREEQVTAVVNEWRRRHLAQPKYGWDRWLDAVPFVAVVKAPFMGPILLSADHPLIAGGLATMTERIINQSPRLEDACDVNPEGACKMRNDYGRFAAACCDFTAEQAGKIFTAFIVEHSS